MITAVAAEREDRPAANAPAFAYSLGVCLAGLGAASAVLLAAGVSASQEFLILFSLSLLLGSRTIQLSSTIELSLALPFIYAAMMHEGLGEAVAVSAAAALGTALARPRPIDALRLSFRTAVMTLSTAAAGAIYRAAGGDFGSVSLARSIVPLAPSVLVYHLMTSSLAATFTHLTQQVSWLRAWSGRLIRSALSSAAGPLAGLGLAALLARFDFPTLLLALPPGVLIYYLYRTGLERIEMRRHHIEEIRTLGEEFEAKTAARLEELAHANRILEEGNLELTRANRMKSEFLAEVSRELRAPLNTIIGSSRMLLGSGRTASEEERIQCAEEIQESARRLQEIVSDVHELSRMEAGEMTLHLETFPVEDVAEEARIRISPDAKAKGIEIGARYAENLPRIHADPSKIKQVLYNLLSNAVKLAPVRGRVELSVETAGNEFTFTVGDTGIGISPEDHDGILPRSMRLDGSYARRYQGAGLGLALVKCYVEMHGGRIWADSRPDSGSGFSFSIPLRDAGVQPDTTLPAAPEAPAEESSSGVRRRASSARTILVVEDNPLNMKLVRDLLRQRGHCVIEAISGREALLKARGASVDLILMDLELPDMDGLEATQWLKADPVTRHIPTVALSARAEKGDDERVLAAGCCGRIAEPIDAARFPAIVESYLRN